jgi:hypothetical protein
MVSIPSTKLTLSDIRTMYVEIAPTVQRMCLNVGPKALLDCAAAHYPSELGNMQLLFSKISLNKLKK